MFVERVKLLFVCFLVVKLDYFVYFLVLLVFVFLVSYYLGGLMILNFGMRFGVFNFIFEGIFLYLRIFGGVFLLILFFCGFFLYLFDGRFNLFGLLRFIGRVFFLIGDFRV